MKNMLQSRIAYLIVSRIQLECEGSIAIPSEIMQEAALIEYEQVHVLNVNTGSRFITYVVPSEDNEVVVMGAAARLALPKDRLIIISYKIVDPGINYKVRFVTMNDDNTLYKTDIKKTE